MDDSALNQRVWLDDVLRSPPPQFFLGLPWRDQREHHPTSFFLLPLTVLSSYFVCVALVPSLLSFCCLFKEQTSQCNDLTSALLKWQVLQHKKRSCLRVVLLCVFSSSYTGLFVLLKYFQLFSFLHPRGRPKTMPTRKEFFTHVRLPGRVLNFILCNSKWHLQSLLVTDTFLTFTHSKKMKCWRTELSIYELKHLVCVGTYQKGVSSMLKYLQLKAYV